MRYHGMIINFLFNLLRYFYELKIEKYILFQWVKDNDITSKEVDNQTNG